MLEEGLFVAVFATGLLPFSRRLFLSLRWTSSTVLPATTDVGHVFSLTVVQRGRTWPLDGLIWPKTGCASIV
jgi:hypothetical protein